MAVTTPVNSGYTIINGTTTGSNGSKVNTWVEYKVTAQSVANNTSTVRVILYSQATWDSGTAHLVTASYGHVAIDSTSQSYSMSGGYDFGDKKLNKFADATFTVTHGTDGKKTVTIGGSWSDIKSNGQPYSTYISGGSVSASVTLPQIARASTVSSLSTTLGTAGTITITRQSIDFTHTLTYAFGSASGTIVTKTTSTSVSWTPDVSLINQLGANSSSGIGTITCTTYSGNTVVGTSTSTLTLTVPSSSLANVTGNYGSAVTLTATNACASGLTYTYQYNNGSSWVSIATGSTSKTQSWTPPTSLIANVSNSKTGTVSIRVITYVGTATVNTATATATLTIPASTGQNVSGVIGSAISIPITKKHSQLTTTIRYSFGSLSNQNIVTKTTSTTYSWSPSSTVCTNLLNQIPNATTGVGTITLESFNGTASLGTTSYTLTLTVASTVVPTLSIGTPTKVNSNATVSGWGVYLQGYSQVKIALTANGASGSTISRMSLTGQGMSSSSTPGTSSATLEPTSSVFSVPGTFTYEGNAQDSRGRAATKVTSSSITVLPYTAPSLNNVSIGRCDSTGAGDTSGTYLRVQYTPVYESVGNRNSFTAYLQYKVTTDTAWTQASTALDGDNVLNLNLSISVNFQARIRYYDSLSGNKYSNVVTIPSDARIINVSHDDTTDKDGLAIGGFSTEAGKLEVYYPTDFEGSTAPTFNSINNITYYTDTHISATNYNSIEAFYDALPSSVQTSVWCKTATDRPMASGGMVTVFKEDNSYGYVIFHGTGGHYFTKRKTGGVWQSWIALMIGSLSGTNLTTSYSMTGNIAMGDTSRFLTAKSYTTSSTSYDDYYNFAKALCDDWIAKDTGTYVANISWANVSWGFAIILVRQNTYIGFEWLTPYDTIIRGQLWNGTYTATLSKQRGDLIQATANNISVSANTWTTICSITLPAGAASLVGSVLNLPASNNWDYGDLVIARFSGQDFVRTSCHPWGPNTGQASMCLTEHVINNSQTTVALQVWSSKAFTFTGTGRLQASMRSRFTTV